VVKGEDVESAVDSTLDVVSTIEIIFVKMMQEILKVEIDSHLFQV